MSKPLKYPIRGVIVADKGNVLVNFDLAQAESWVVAYLADEPTMKHVLAHGDFHTETGQKALHDYTDEQWDAMDAAVRKAIRYTGKRYNHASAYRMGPYRAAEVINKDSDKPPYVTVTLAESKNFYRRWHDYYHIKGWWDEIETQLNNNRTLVTPYGRIRVFFDHWGEELFKKATAYVPQSTVADHLNGKIQPELGIAGGFVEVDKQFVKPGYVSIVNQSHDSLMLEIPTTSALDICPQIHRLLLRPLIVNGEEMTIPVDCEIGERWGELKEMKRETGSYEIDFQLAA